MLQKESEIQSQILAWLGSKGYLAARMPLSGKLISRGGKSFMVGNHMSGFPDIFGYFPGGQGFVIEVKTAKGKVSPKQEAWLKSLRDCGVATLVARSLDDVIKFMGGF